MWNTPPLPKPMLTNEALLHYKEQLMKLGFFFFYFHHWTVKVLHFSRLGPKMLLTSCSE